MSTPCICTVTGAAYGMDSICLFHAQTRSARAAQARAERADRFAAAEQRAWDALCLYGSGPDRMRLVAWMRAVDAMEAA